MKTTPVPLEAIADWPALRRAWRMYRCGKRRRPEVATFELDADRTLLRLSRSLLSQNYRPGGYRLMQIRDPKARLIAVAPVVDRVVHTALCQALGPFFNRGLIDDTYACLKGRGQHRALWRFLEFQRRYGYVMHMDIHRYYPNVDHGILKTLLMPRIRDGRIGELLQKILYSGGLLYQRPAVRRFFGTQTPKEQADRGLPIGNLTSQWWGNVYLNGLDHFIKRDLKITGYLRYMDDLVCFSNDRGQLKAVRQEIADWLWEKRRLHLNPKKSHIVPTYHTARFLGYRVTRAGYDLDQKSFKRMRHRLRRMSKGAMASLDRTLVGWRGTVLL